jgi:hypothetical protein
MDAPCWTQKNVFADDSALTLDGPRSGLSDIVARTVRACAESVRVSDFLRDLLAKSVRLTWEPIYNESRSPLYIDEGLWPIEPTQSI